MNQQSKPRVTPWSGTTSPTPRQIEERMSTEGLSPYQWSNGPGDRYSPHSHAYDKVIYVVRGSIAFGLPETADTLELTAGDRLELPAGMLHDAIVGPTGVVCLEAHK